MAKTIHKKIADLQREDIANRKPILRYKRAIREAKKRGMAWRLSFKSYAVLVVLPCSYCHIAKFESGTGLDRIDSSKGYYLDNVVPACYICNVMKGVFPAELFRYMASKVKK